MKENPCSEILIDFLSKKMRYRSEHASLRNELIARALGVKPRDNPRIIDATAGLGRDSFILAALGFEITLLERSPLLYEKLSEALKAAASDPQIGPIVSRMHLQQADAIEWLPNLPEQERPEVIYLDPMFPERKKSASIKKEMAIMQELLGKDSDHVRLFESAFACATKRIVVKRPRLAANIVDLAPNYTLAGKSSRFDIYLVRAK